MVAELVLISVGAGALDSPLEGARFELSRVHVENIMWITQMRLQTKCRRVGTSGAPSPTNALCGYSGLLGMTHIVDVCCTDNARFVGRPRRANAVRPYRCVAVRLLV